MIRIAVIGDLMLDSYVAGASERISPEAPVPVVLHEKTTNVLGGAGNVYRNLVGLGVNSILIGVVGDDEAGNFIKEQSTRSSILTLDPSQYSTTIKRRIVSGRQQIVRVDNESSKQPIRSNIILFVQEILSNFKPDAIIFSDYNKGFITYPLVEFVKIAMRGVLLVADPKQNLSMYDGFDTITPNKKEYDSCIVKPNVENTLVTLGSDGMKLITKDDEFEIPTIAKQVYDVTGAGDTVTAAYTYLRCKGMEPLASARFANAAAGVVVSKFGTSAITYDEIEHIIDPTWEDCNRSKTVEKVWGKEIWFANSQLYCGKILYLKKGYICSYHHHKIKDETFYILSGKIEMVVNKSKFTMTEGERINLKPYDKHSFAGIEDSVIIEVSTQHFESDSYRKDKSREWENYEYWEEVKRRMEEP